VNVTVVEWADLRLGVAMSADAVPWIPQRQPCTGVTGPTGVGLANAGSVGGSPGPVQAGDAAQARLFSQLLRDEIATLQQLAASAEERWMGPDRRDSGPTPEPVRRVRARIEDVWRLLQALGDRFPDA
jgi:hypothetical protein